MAEDIRTGHSEEGVTDPRAAELIVECRTQAESCLYTGAGLYIWQKWARFWRAFFLVAPIVVGGLATSQILTNFWGQTGEIFAAMLTMLAGFFPAIYVALSMDMRLVEIGRSATEFTNLRDRFRLAGNVASHGPLEEFKTQFESLMDRMDAARSAAPPAPEWCFEKAKLKVRRGDYTYDPNEKKGVGGKRRWGFWRQRR